MEGLARANRQEIKGMHIEKKEVKLSLFTDNMILYVENPNVATKITLALMNKFSKISGNEINTRKM